MKKNEEKQDMEKAEVKTLRIDMVAQDPRFQVRVKMDKVRVMDLAKAYRAGCELPSVQVVKIEKAYVLVDGWHRIEALKLNGATEVEAEVTENGTEKDAFSLAWKANMCNAKALVRKDMPGVFRAYMEAGDWRDSRGRRKGLRIIEQDLMGQIKHTTVARWMKKDFSKIYREYYQGEGAEAPGGLPDRRSKNMLAQRTEELLTQALATFKGVDDAEIRGGLIRQAEVMLEEMKKNGEWAEVQENNGFCDF